MKRRNLVLGLTAATAALWHSASAQPEFPARPVRLVTPFGAGTASDTLLRALGRKLAEAWGGAVVVENREGASGVIGTRFVASAPPDGHTLLLAVSPPFAVTPLLQKDAGYDPLQDFVPIARIAEVPMVLVASAKAPFASFDAFVRHARAHPGRLDYASAGIGVPSHLFMEQLKQTLGLDISFVPYKSTGQMYTDVISGQVPLAMVAVGAARPHLESGAWRALAIGAAARHPLLPSVPTMQELTAGVDLSGMSIWFGIMAPRGLPAELARRLSADVERAARSADFQAVLAAQLATPLNEDARAFATFLQTSQRRNLQLIQGLKLPAGN